MNTFPEVFPAKPPIELPPLREGCNHKVEFKPGAEINFRIANIRTPDKYMPHYRALIDRWLKAGICEPSEAVAACPMWAIKKPGKDEPRFVTDLRQRNKITFDEKQPMMNQDRMREVAARAKFISKLDMKDSYFQTRLEPDQEDNNTINTPFGVFKVRVMLQGDHRAPATLTRAMTNILRCCIGKFVWVYLDDIIIYSDSLEEHIHHIGIVLTELRNNRYYLNLNKCQHM